MKRIKQSWVIFWVLVLGGLWPSGAVWGEPAADSKVGKGGAVAPPIKAAPVVEGQESPHDTMLLFLRSYDEAYREGRRPGGKESEARKNAMERVLGCMDLSRIKKGKGWRHAVMLRGVLNKLSDYEKGARGGAMGLDTVEDLASFDAGKAPSRAVYFSGDFSDFESSRKLQLDVEYPDVKPRGKIVLVKQVDGAWRFSADTVSGIKALELSLRRVSVIEGLRDTSEGEIDAWLRHQINRFFPEWSHDRAYLYLEVWQWVTLLLLVFLGVILDRVVRFLVRRIASWVIHKQGGEPDVSMMRETVRPAGLLVMALFWLNLVWVLGLSDTADMVIEGAARIFAVLATVLFAWRLTDLVSDALGRKAAATSNKFDDVLVPMVRTAFKIFIVIMGVIYGSMSLNFDIEPLLGSLAIGGVGFAFAAKDTLENFFGSATVLIDQPFAVGDWIVVGDVEGTVERIGFRSTRVRTFYNSLITVPNANLVRATVDNYGHRKYRRYKTILGVEYGTDPEKLLAFTEGIREIIRSHPYTRKDYFQVWLNDFNASSLDILLYVFFEVPEWTTELRERERLMIDVIRLADVLGVGFAYPTQTLHLVNEGDAAPREQLKTPSGTTDVRSQVKGIRAAKAMMKAQRWQDEKPPAYDFNMRAEEGQAEESGEGKKETYIEDRTSGA